VRTTKITSEIGAKTCTICDSPLSLSLSLSLQIEAASENHNWEGLQQKNGITERERERERESTNKVHKKLPLLKEEKETKGKKRKTFF